MFYGLTANQTFWEERLNLFVALAPVTKITHTTSSLVKYLVSISEPLYAILHDL